MSSPSVEQALDSRRADDLFGHPRGLSFLFATEMWERFSYYGMRALLVLYMTKYLLLNGRAENVAGLSAAVGGPETTTINLTQGTYTLRQPNNFWYGPTGLPALTGKTLTIADTSIASSLTHAQAASIPVSDHKNVQRWFASIEKLDAWKKTAPPAMG